MKSAITFLVIVSGALAAVVPKKFDASAFARGVDSIVLYSLLPSDVVVVDLHGNRAGPFQGSEHFHGFPVLGKIEVLEEERASMRSALAATLKVIAGDRAPSLCFTPRHGVCLKKGDEHIDVLLCFECEEARVIIHRTVSSEKFEMPISVDALERLDAALDRRSVQRDIPKKKRPNKAPEPTPTAVTPRAIEDKSK